VTFERQVMVDAVEAERALRGLAAADPRRLRGAESAAVGHIDYMEKFARYCAEIALGDGES